MKTRDQMDYEPDALEFSYGPCGSTVAIREDIERHERDDGSAYWTCFVTNLELGVGELTEELRKSIEADPLKYRSYVSLAERPALQATYTGAVQAWMDAEAMTHGYDDIKSAVGYENSDDPVFRAEAVACRSWRDRVWRACYSYMDGVLALELPLLPVPEFLAMLPRMEWPA